MSPLRIADILPNVFAPLGGQPITSITQIPLIVAGLIQILLIVIAALAVIFIIVSGIQYIASEGDPSKTANAKNALKNAIIGVILSASAYLIVDYLARQFS
ncbi:MAG TPA: pilin [Candidatus Saccharimonadales bacterium]|nr:pilin [Candidatus Saccharimonadales bacterium]